MIFNFLYLKRICLFLLIFSSCLILPLQSKNYFSIYGGVNYNEELFTVVYQTQFSPKISFDYTNEKVINNFSLKNSLNFDFLIWHLYYKNNYLYYTNKTLSVESPLEYDFTMTFPDKQKVKFIIGGGIQYNIRFDRYSMGKYYWHSRLKFEPLLYGIIGIELRIMKFQAILKHNIGGLISAFLLYNKDEFFINTFCYDFFNRIELDLSYNIISHIWFILKWTNKFNYYSDMDIYITNFFLFQNSFFIGLRYEI